MRFFRAYYTSALAYNSNTHLQVSRFIFISNCATFWCLLSPSFIHVVSLVLSLTFLLTFPTFPFSLLCFLSLLIPSYGENQSEQTGPRSYSTHVQQAERLASRCFGGCAKRAVGAVLSCLVSRFYLFLSIIMCIASFLHTNNDNNSSSLYLAHYIRTSLMSQS